MTRTVAELIEGETGRIGPWDVWRDVGGGWWVNGRAVVRDGGPPGTSIDVRRAAGGVLELDASRVLDYGFAFEAAQLGPDVASLPASVSPEVEAAAAAAARGAPE